MARIVYVVEDEEHVARSLGFLLALDGYEPVRFHRADAFLLELPQLEPGHVVMNIALPGTDGIEALAEMRMRGVHWPVVVLTGHARAEFESAVLSIGGASYLEKPCEPEKVLSAIRESDGAF